MSGKAASGGWVKTAEGVIRARRESLAFRAEVAGLAWKVALLVAFAFVVGTQLTLLCQVRGMDMFPALEDGDAVAVWRLGAHPAKEDVVAYRVEGQRHFGRVVACEGDVVDMSDSGTLLVNGTVQEGEVVYPTYAEEGGAYPLKVPDGCVFVLGDYRTQAQDSRTFGPVPEADVEGKVVTLVRRRAI